MERVNLIFLHGFLGRPTDWALVKAYLPPTSGIHVYTPDFFKDPVLGPQFSFETWADNFIKWTERIVGFNHRIVLVGYSLGGRLALHALEKKPQLWDKVILVSTNPGIDDDFHDNVTLSDERKKRWLSDSYWAEEFLNSPWDAVLRNWNAQPVFSGSNREPLRVETDYVRESLGLTLTQWSLAQQKNMRNIFKRYVEKVHMIVGEADEKFVHLAAQLKEQVSGLQVDVISGASHRIPFDNPKALGERVRQLVGK